MRRYSFRRKDLKRIEEELTRMGYEVDHQLSGLIVKDEKIRYKIYLYPKNAYISPKPRKGNVNEREKALINFIKREYRSLLSSEELITYFFLLLPAWISVMTAIIHYFSH